MSSDTAQGTSPWTAALVVVGVLALIGVLAANMLVPALNSETTEYATFCVAYNKPSKHVGLLEDALGQVPGAVPLASLREVEKGVFELDSLENPPPGLGEAAQVFREAMLQALDDGSLTPVQTPEVQQAIATLEGHRNLCPASLGGPIKD